MIPSPLLVWFLVLRLADGSSVVFAERPYASDSECNDAVYWYNVTHLKEPKTFAYCKVMRRSVP